jgi:hypothetical protein
MPIEFLQYTIFKSFPKQNGLQRKNLVPQNINLASPFFKMQIFQIRKKVAPVGCEPASLASTRSGVVYYTKPAPNVI